MPRSSIGIAGARQRAQDGAGMWWRTFAPGAARTVYNEAESDRFMKAKKTASNLETWLADPRADAYFGRRFVFKSDVLAQVVSGSGTLAEIGRRHNASRQAAYKHAAAARRIFGL